MSAGASTAALLLMACSLTSLPTSAVAASGNAGSDRVDPESAAQTGPTESDNAGDLGEYQTLAEVSPEPGTDIFPDGLIMLVL